MVASANAESSPGPRANKGPVTPAGQPGRARRVVLLVALVLGLGSVALGYHFWRTVVALRLPPAIGATSGAAAGFNVVLLTIDTLRADRVGCYGYGRVQTPNIDRLAAEGIRFDDAVTVVPMTLPAHASILTGSYPPTHGVRDNGTYRLVPEKLTLPERLKEAGYRTAAFVGAFVLDRRYGLDQGFDEYDDLITLKHRTRLDRQADPQRPGDTVTDLAIAWLEGHKRESPDRPFFLWVHLFDPHTPYDPPEPFRTRYATSLYDGEVAFTDQQVGRILETLRALALHERTVQVLVGDHGEGLGEHGESNHSLLIYGSTMRVPLILHAPSVFGGAKVVDDRVVAIVDVTPTILDLLGLDPPGADGVSLLQPAADRNRAIYLETLSPFLNHGWSSLHGLHRHGDKFIEAPAPEYFDLDSDRQEQRNLWYDGNHEAEQLRERLTAMIQEWSAPGHDDAASMAPDAEAIEKLAALGYVSGGAGGTAAGPLPDPKDVILHWERTVAAQFFVDQGRHQEAVALVGQMLQMTPQDARLWSLLSHAQAQAQHFDEALQSRLKSIDFQPTDPNYWIHLAELQYRLADEPASRLSLAQAERLEPDNGAVHLLQAQMVLDAGRHDEAIVFCELARRRDPTRHTATSWALQGRICWEKGELEQARAAYERAHAADAFDAGALLGLATIAEADGSFERVVDFAAEIQRGEPQWPQSRALLARAYLQLDRGNEAVEAMEALTHASPDNPAAHNNLGNVLFQRGRMADAAKCYRTAIELDPGYALAHHNLAMALERQGEVDAAIMRLRVMLEIQPDSRDGCLDLARLLDATGHTTEAGQIAERLLEMAPVDARSYRLAADIRDRLGDPGGAIALLKEAHQQLVDDREVTTALAWRLATSPRSELRDGDAAVRLAEEALAVEGAEAVELLDALAAAYARVGRFDDAVATARRALRLAEVNGAAEPAHGLESRLKLYERHEAYDRPADRGRGDD